MPASPPTVVVGLSGGVDSAVAAHRLKTEGYEVIGLFMKNWEEDDDETYCAAREDLAAAEAVSETLGIPLKTVNFSHEYWERVFTIFLDEYRAGRTPNPDVLCNREIKFKEFLSYAKDLGAHHIATGHYARVIKEGGSHRLLKALDLAKDQSYFLHELEEAALGVTIFPLGEIDKQSVREEARNLGLPNAERKDSTGICFIGERKFSDFLARYLPMAPGPIKTLEQETVGEHRGLWFYTAGQRHGLDIGGPGEAWYVAEKDMANNVLYVVQGHDHSALMKQSLIVDKMHWISGSAPGSTLRCSAKTRYRQEDQPCSVIVNDMGGISVAFDSPQRAPTPGQSLALYEGTTVLGGGVISSTQSAETR